MATGVAYWISVGMCIGLSMLELKMLDPMVVETESVGDNRDCNDSKQWEKTQSGTETSRK